jgi:hypothetical protein
MSIKTIFDQQYISEKIGKLDSQEHYDSFNQFCDLICQWNFKSINGIEKSDIIWLVAGLAYATICQSMWTWRPLVHISGQSGAGKSKFLNLLENFFKGIALRRSKPTEAALRQEIGNKSLAVLIDELEHDRHRKTILEYLRTAGDGSIISRGSRIGNVQLYGLKHIVWIASIELNLEVKADANRFIVFELEPPEINKRKTLSIPRDELAYLGRNALVFLIEKNKILRKRAEEISSLTFGSHDIRTIECYTIPVVIIEEIMRCNGLHFDAAEYLEMIMNKIETTDEIVQNDHERLIEDILNFEITVTNKGKFSILQTISMRQMPNDEFDMALERAGIIFRFVNLDVSYEKAGHIGFYPNAIKQNITRQLSQWNEISIGDILKRHPKSAKFDNRIKIRGVQKRCVWIPYDAIIKSSESDNENKNENEIPEQF